MTLSISDTDNITGVFDRAKRRSRILYSASALFFFIFQLIYEHFSHSVISYYMVFAFLIPIAGGLLSELWFRVFRTGSSASSGIFFCSLQLLAGAVMWLTLGSVFEGVLQIYGTTNRLIIVFVIAGCVQMAVSMVILLYSARQK